VFVLKPDGTVEQRQVKLGQRQGALTVVEEGLTAGEQVVTRGQMALTSGAKVQVAPPAEADEEGAPAVREGGQATGEKMNTDQHRTPDVERPASK
jgi:hypothetical protein